MSHRIKDWGLLSHRIKKWDLVSHSNKNSPRTGRDFSDGTGQSQTETLVSVLCHGLEPTRSQEQPPSSAAPLSPLDTRHRHFLSSPNPLPAFPCSSQLAGGVGYPCPPTPLRAGNNQRVWIPHKVLTPSQPQKVPWNYSNFTTIRCTGL